MIDSIFAPAKKVHFIRIPVLAKANTGLTERMDQWNYDGRGYTCYPPVCRVFELKSDGKIFEWREYYGNQVWLYQSGPRSVPQPV